MVCQLSLPSLARTRMPPDPVVAECGGLPGCPARAGEAKRRRQPAQACRVPSPVVRRARHAHAGRPVRCRRRSASCLPVGDRSGVPARRSSASPRAAPPRSPSSSALPSVLSRVSPRSTPRPANAAISWSSVIGPCSASTPATTSMSSGFIAGSESATTRHATEATQYPGQPLAALHRYPDAAVRPASAGRPSECDVGDHRAITP